MIDSAALNVSLNERGAEEIDMNTGHRGFPTEDEQVVVGKNLISRNPNGRQKQVDSG